MNEEQFKCKECGFIIKASNYDYKDYWLFVSLKNGGICEDCLRFNSYGHSPLIKWHKKNLLEFLVFIRVYYPKVFYEAFTKYDEVLRGN